MITLKNIKKVYGKKENKFTALDGVSLEIELGTSFAIIGKSGSGKSTLMHIVSGLDKPSSGSIIVNGRDLSKLKKRALDKFRSEEVSFIFQSFFIEGNQTCYQNVALPLEIARVPLAKRKKMVLQALESVELLEKANVKAKNLSGGQKQRLAIARSIVNKPKIIFADEPTGNLDSKTGEKIIKLLFGLNKKLGATLIVVTHDNDLASKCDRQVILSDGRVIKDSKESQQGNK